MRWFWDSYVPDPAARADPTVALLEAAADGGLGDLAPAVVATAELDPLRDVGRAYADALAAAGVAVRRREGARLPHGYLGFAGVAPAARAEVDAVLTARTEVRAAVTAVHGTGPDATLVSWVVPADRAVGVDTDVLRRHVAARLPRHFVPASITVIDEVPRTTNGKLDRRALPEPQARPVGVHRTPTTAVAVAVAMLASRR